MNHDGYVCCDYDDYTTREVLPRDLTDKIKAARLLRDAGHMDADAYTACIASIVDEHIPG